MSEDTLSSIWSQRFGLAKSPMFAFEQASLDGEHHVLLDGGHGSFGLSVTKERTDPTAVAGWAWSSDLPHHVTVTGSDVQVVRWDAAQSPQVYSANSVLRDPDGFYRSLCGDRLRSNRTVVQHLIALFGRVRSLVAHARLPDDRAIDALVTILADLIAGDEAPADTAAYGLPQDAAELRAALAGPALDDAMRDISNAPAALSALRLHPSLTIRHAGGQLFQEAHFDLVRAPPPDLFGYVGKATAEPNSRGGTHFTPPALARSIVDYTILQLDRLPERASLVVSDPACGSAAFLHEGIRGLRRAGFDGRLKVVGRDVSAPAVAMARFTLTLALRDWTPSGGAELDLAVGDSLATPVFPEADLTVMNPPFISVIAQTAEQKAQLRATVGDKAGSRGDYSMAFVTKALAALVQGGAMGTLFPANLLTHEAATSWREGLARDGDVSLLGSIGDFGLFSQALVHVACAVIRKSPERRTEFTALVSGNEPGATGDALRELRKANGVPPARAAGDRDWKIFAAENRILGTAIPWRILTPEERGMLDALEAAQVPTVGSLFEIAQGVQTGNLKVFLLDNATFDRLGLPKRERCYFRSALMTDSIEDGRIVKRYHLFYPHGENGPLFADEAAVEAALPTYFRLVLKPNEAALRARASIVQSKRSDWWGLMRPRTSSFAFDMRPRIVSKFFGAEGSFALDREATYLPSTGHVWRPRRDDVTVEPEAAAADSLAVLRAYVALLNSRAFMRLVSFRSVTVAGGQFDLSSRFLDGVFLPDLWERSEDPLLADCVRRLAREGAGDERINAVRATRVDRLVARLYGVDRLAEG